MEYAVLQAEERSAKRTRLEDVRRMKEANIALEFISNITGLSKEEVEKL